MHLHTTFAIVIGKGSKGSENMKEYKIGNAIVRVRGEVDKDNIKKATEDFMRKVIKQRAKNAKQETE